MVAHSCDVQSGGTEAATLGSYILRLKKKREKGAGKQGLNGRALTQLAQSPGLEY